LAIRGRGYTDGTSYAGAVVQDGGGVALASRGRRWVVIERCFQGGVDKAVDVAMGYALTALCHHLIESINHQRDLTLVKSNVTGGRCATAPQLLELVGTPCRREIYPTRP
jgi:hypothetical protein